MISDYLFNEVLLNITIQQMLKLVFKRVLIMVSYLFKRVSYTVLSIGLLNAANAMENGFDFNDPISSSLDFDQENFDFQSWDFTTRQNNNTSAWMDTFSTTELEYETESQSYFSQNLLVHPQTNPFQSYSTSHTMALDGQNPAPDFKSTHLPQFQSNNPSAFENYSYSNNGRNNPIAYHGPSYPQFQSHNNATSVKNNSYGRVPTNNIRDYQRYPLTQHNERIPTTFEKDFYPKTPFQRSQSAYQFLHNSSKHAEKSTLENFDRVQENKFISMNSSSAEKTPAIASLSLTENFTSNKYKKRTAFTQDDFDYMEIVRKRKLTNGKSIPSFIEKSKNEEMNVEINAVKQPIIIEKELEKKENSKEKVKNGNVLKIKFNREAIFNKRCAFSLTDDQNKAISDITKDMNSDRIMDRVIIAPVGAGKTEVAMHAAFQAIKAKKQVVVLCPLVGLAHQHFTKFENRFKGLARVVCIAKGKTKGAKMADYAAVERGEYDIIIGTHGLLSEKRSYPKLGLTIIDEEQAFGVKQKTFLDNKYPDAHTLILTATPMPRTQSLISQGLYQSTEMTTLPEGKLPTIETLLSHDRYACLPLIKKEKEQKGQIFFVTKKIDKLTELEPFIKENCPDIHYKMLHGAMHAAIQKSTLEEFRQGKFDLLLSTDIIGMGVDISNANTIIIDEANYFGLNQLTQLRGRVGRGSVQGHAMLLYDALKISDKALSRLKTMEKYTSINDCKNISKIDLELRGAGDVLGTKQHGRVNSKSIEILDEYLIDFNK